MRCCCCRDDSGVMAFGCRRAATIGGAWAHGRNVSRPRWGDSLDIRTHSIGSHWYSFGLCSTCSFQAEDHSIGCRSSFRREPVLRWPDVLPHRCPTYCSSSPGVRHVPLFPYPFATALNGPVACRGADQISLAASVVDEKTALPESSRRVRRSASKRLTPQSIRDIGYSGRARRSCARRSARNTLSRC